MTVFSRNHPPRRGAALIIALVLLVVIGAVTSVTLPQILRDRQAARMELVRGQAQWLLDDALRLAEAKRLFDSEFSGETMTLGPGNQPFDGVFLVTTKYKDGRFHAEVEYSGGKGKTHYRVDR